MYSQCLSQKQETKQIIKRNADTMNLSQWNINIVYIQCLAKKQEVKQIRKSKADTNRAWEQSKELSKQQNSTQRHNDLNASSIAPLRLRLSLYYPLLFKWTQSEAPRNYNVPSKNLCDPNRSRVGSVVSLVILLEGSALKWQRLCWTTSPNDDE